MRKSNWKGTGASQASLGTKATEHFEKRRWRLEPEVTAARDFPGGPVDKTPCSQCKELGFDPCSANKVPYATWHCQKKKKIEVITAKERRKRTKLCHLGWNHRTCQLTAGEGQSKESFTSDDWRSQHCESVRCHLPSKASADSPVLNGNTRPSKSELPTLLCFVSMTSFMILWH